MIKIKKLELQRFIKVRYEKTSLDYSKKTNFM